MNDSARDFIMLCFRRKLKLVHHFISV